MAQTLIKTQSKHRLDELFITKQEQKARNKNKNWVASQQALSFNAPS